MRLFFAICLSPAIKQELNDIVKQLRKDCVRGNFTRPENFHLTLAFIGETDRPDAAKRALQTLTGTPFELQAKGIGWFRRSGGDICYLRCEGSPALPALQKRLTTLLKAEGFKLEDRPFKAHLTLGREVQIYPDFDEAAFTATLPEISMKVERVSLMKSERTGGKVTYTEIAGKDLYDTF